MKVLLIKSNLPELQFNKANASDTEIPFLDLHLSVSNGFVSTNIYDKLDDFDFGIVKFPFLDGDVPRRPSYWVYISQLIRFARSVEPSSLNFLVLFVIYLFYRDDSLTSQSFTMRTEQLTKCSEPLQKLRSRLGTRLTGLSPPVTSSKAALLIWFSVFACFGVSFCTGFTICVSR